MSNKNIEHLIHKRSSQVVDNQPKLPTSEQIEYGEIAVNYAKGHETLSIKNSDNEIVPLSFKKGYREIEDSAVVINIETDKDYIYKLTAPTSITINFPVTSYINTTDETNIITVEEFNTLDSSEQENYTANGWKYSNYETLILFTVPNVASFNIIINGAHDLLNLEKTQTQSYVISILKNQIIGRKATYTSPGATYDLCSI